ncbi:MAG: hypothetical protein AB7O56_14435 [Bauldia sp.]
MASSTPGPHVRGSLTPRQLEMLETGSFRFDGYSRAEEVIEAHKLIRAGYVTPIDVGGPAYTCIRCEISEAGRTALAQAGRPLILPERSVGEFVL